MALTKNFDYGLSKVTTIIYETLKELGVEIKEINLNELNLDYYDGTLSEKTEQLFLSIKDSNGLIFASTSELFTVCALMQTFLEYFKDKQFSKYLHSKNCFLVTVSEDCGERSTLEYLSKIINSLNGFDSVKIGLNSKITSEITSELKDIIEKQSEDFYRISRQNRKFIIPSDSFIFEDSNVTQKKYN